MPLDALLLAALLSVRSVRAQVPALAGAPSPTPPPGAAASDPGQPNAEAYRSRILQDLDPYAAEEYLKDPAIQQAVEQSAPGTRAHVFQVAAKLKDLLDLLVSNPDADTLRQGLAQRWANPLASSPARLLAWIQRYANSIPADAARKAVWEWDTLTDEQRAWLSSQGQDAAGWAKLSVADRLDRMNGWAGGVYAQLMKTSPKTPAELAAMRRRAEAVWGALSHDQVNELGRRLDAAEAAVSGLADARTRFAKTHDPKLQALIAQAESAGSLEGTLSALAQSFDGAGAAPTALLRAAPATAAQTFTNGDRALLAAELKQGLLREVAGTTPGDVTARFFQTHRLDLQVADIGDPIGLYNPRDDSITFNERFITEYLKTRGVSVKDLLSDGKVFDPLVTELSPLFVHESTHQRQHAWGKANGIPDWEEQDKEIEAMSMEALYINEKARSDPAFARQLAADQGSLSLAKESIIKANHLARDPDSFGAGIRAYYYPGTPSLEAVTAQAVTSEEWELARLRRELARRAALPPDRQRALAAGGAASIPDDVQTDADWIRGAQALSTPALNALIDGTQRRMDAVPAQYSALRGRYDDTDALVRRELGTLDKPKPARVEGDVPPPATAGGRR